MTRAKWTTVELDEWSPVRYFGYTHAAVSPDGQRRIVCGSKREANAKARAENAKEAQGAAPYDRD